ncbi:GNAT family N-acetyltransferase [Myroides marinus]|uniref:GNAT family N-acetyltransferase n=1 Tax=Myroides marinus TaxID=703342 RepID=UPI0025763257|nr:GNAT family N-acetyltransferase [Myroides marinus]MDM1346180.1 GNAT family N-acetyltransferase [Myroides marinus]MDM1351167.1 GNAT family N-acetyltransferase [Myroides marinus]MDM1353434.1 GNAT family N-acetyltransferase [Myroides marinus]MDM1358317.1 GNAT family N-acetyltransferase [Myroides marinus]MDM1362726.1 GNAT family N-acetyltransferase [Myroides marinus]
MNVSISNLKHITIVELVEVFNDSFSDYILPFHLTEESLSFKLNSELIDLELSVGAYDGERLVGFMLTGVRREGEEVYYYNAGTGVRPSHRGLRLVALMYNYALPIWEKGGKKVTLTLEVIKGNDKAIKAYQAQGYEVSRDLLCFKGEPREVHYIDNNIVIKDVEEVCWNTVTTFWDIQPSWQNSIAVLNQTKEDVRYKLAEYNGEIVGYIAYHKSSGKVFQIAVSKSYRHKRIGRLLINDVVNMLEKPLLVTNVDHRGSEVVDFLNKIGLEMYITQHEMTKRVK